MKEVKLYICEICNTQFKDKNECKKCEDGHVKIKEIKSVRYRPAKDTIAGIPETIEVLFENGKSYIYKH